MPELKYIQIHSSPVKLETEAETESELGPSSNDTELDSASRIVPNDEVDKKLAQRMNELQLVEEEKNWREVDVPKAENLDEPMIDLPHSSLSSSDLKIKSLVNVRTLNNPSDFVVWEFFNLIFTNTNFIDFDDNFKITLVEEGADYDNMLIQMKIFYKNSDNNIYKATSDLKINNVYVARRDEDSSYARVRLTGIIPGVSCIALIIDFFFFYFEVFHVVFY